MTRELLDPLAASQRIEDDYRSYLVTSYAPADPALREDFVEALASSGRIRRGPILQATPPYRPGATVRQLAAEGVLHPKLGEGSAALPADRPLHGHQEAALRRIRANRNLIIATGTGSGKTECYLIPIIDGLLRERNAGTLAQPGVRALLLYPMNALANDQMARLRALLAPYPEITFGRYIGDTAHTYREALEKYRQAHHADPPPGELIDRATMQETPPSILLTNFAMLEYLLLRPADSSLFDGPTGSHWRWIVLDEVHVYDGAKGAEVAMLLRRVRDRVVRSERGKLRCVGTSATLGRGVADAPDVAGFATALFDEPFAPDDVIHPDRLPLRAADARWRLTPGELDGLHAAWAGGCGPDQLSRVVTSTPLLPGTDQTTASFLWELLKDEAHVVGLQSRLERRSVDLAELADVFEGFPEPAHALTQLVDLCVAARRDEASAPLLPARYHLWLRASEGAFACLHPDHPADHPRLVLDRRVSCAACEAVGRRSMLFELAVCQHCRSHYLVGSLDGERLVQPRSDPRVTVYLRPGEADSDAASVDEDEAAVDDSASADERLDRQWLCCGCGTLTERLAEGCECQAPSWLPVRCLRRHGTDPVMRSCLECGRRSRSGVALRFLSGSEAPVAVVATSLYQSLPPAPEPNRRASADGRKLLMFADSRQDAAFFAPYLRRTYRRAVERRLLWKVLSRDKNAFTFADLVQPLRREAERARFLDEEGDRTNASEARAWLLAEILATDRRQSIDGVGLAEIGVRLPGRFGPPAALAPFGLTDEEALDVVRVLLDTLRQSAAVTVPDDVNVKEDLRFAPRNTTTVLRGRGADPGVLAWVPSKGTNRRLDYLHRLAERRKVTVDAAAVLADLWDELTHPDSGLDGVLAIEHHPSRGLVFALAHERFEFVAHHAGGRPYRCTRCWQIWWRNVSGTCATFRCQGTLEPYDGHDTNHYRHLYESLRPFPLAVEEHTGQLRSELATELQEKFTAGALNALSCSTTFELGVDVGDVQAVLMRNVPPSPANYVQRAGRAGRRLGSPALVTTFAQRRSHDLTYFRSPEAMVDGVITPPVIRVDNPAIVRRHVHSVAFAQFERLRVDAGEQAAHTISELVGDIPPTVADRFLAWLDTKPADLAGALKRIVPDAAAEELGIDDWRWITNLKEPDEHLTGGWLGDLIQKVSDDRRDLERLEQEAASERHYKRAEKLKRTRETLDGRRTLDVLAQHGVLPKYGFPVDVAPLDVLRSEQGTSVELTRDLRLGLLEFAPGARVVAYNQLWRSIGIAVRPGRQLPMYAWGVCNGCGTLRTEFVPPDAGPAEAFRDPCDHCGGADFAHGRRGRFVVPMFGFLGERDRETLGETRPPREGFLETYFADYDVEPPAFEPVDLGGPPRLKARTSRRGWITVVNRGRTAAGFAYCASCGYANDEPPARKKGAVTPSGHPRPYSTSTCRGTLQWVHLGHRFLTNVLELQFPVVAGHPAEVAAQSTLAALIVAASSVGIQQGDLDGSPTVGLPGHHAVVLFDNVPGGAGHTHHLTQHLDSLLRKALERLESCACSPETSCYGCLRTYRNQLHHDQLVRQAAIDTLLAVL